MNRGRRVRVFALGSPHGDDQIGWRIGERLRHDPRWEVELVNSPWDLLGQLRSDDRTVVIDACCSNRVPGEVFCVDPNSADEMAELRWSTHGGRISDVLQLADGLSQRPRELVIVAVAIASAVPGDAMSEEVGQAAGKAEAFVRDLIDSWDGRTLSP